jgi:hypothetical protein
MIMGVQIQLDGIPRDVNVPVLSPPTISMATKDPPLLTKAASTKISLVITKIMTMKAKVIVRHDKQDMTPLIIKPLVVVVELALQLQIRPIKCQFVCVSDINSKN